MSPFLTALARFLSDRSCRVIRLAEAYRGETAAISVTPAPYCQNVYSVAKTFTMTAAVSACERSMRMSSGASAW